jgi:hypothetical protein
VARWFRWAVCLSKSVTPRPKMANRWNKKPMAILFNFIQFRCTNIVKNNNSQLLGVNQPKIHTIPSR